MRGQNNVISTYRFETDGDGHDNYSSTATLDSVNCYIEPMSSRDMAFIVGNPFEGWHLVVDGVQDIQKDDKVVDKDNNEYIVFDIRKSDDIEDTTYAKMKKT